MSWLRPLGPGDQVIFVEASGYRDVSRVANIERVTKTQVIVNSVRFDRDTGWAKGPAVLGGARIRLHEATPEAVDRVIHQENVRHLTGLISRWEVRTRAKGSPPQSIGPQVKRAVDALGDLLEDFEALFRPREGS